MVDLDTITMYEELLDFISNYEVGQEIRISHVAYEWTRSLYQRAIKEGYLIDNYSYNFIVARKPPKYFGESIINSYFG